jgi:hypothetical protein
VRSEGRAWCAGAPACGVRAARGAVWRGAPSSPAPVTRAANARTGSRAHGLRSRIVQIKCLPCGACQQCRRRGPGLLDAPACQALASRCGARGCHRASPRPRLRWDTHLVLLMLWKRRRPSCCWLAKYEARCVMRSASVNYAHVLRSFGAGAQPAFLTHVAAEQN